MVTPDNPTGGVLGRAPQSVIGRHAPEAPEVLMGRFLSGLDEEAFEQIVSQFTAPGLAAARRILLDAALAEDALQETFLRVIRRRKQYHTKRAFSPWFYTILRNVCLDIARKRARQERILRQTGERRAPLVAPSDTAQTEAAELLEALPQNQRDVLVLRAVHGLAFRDVAAAMGISVEAAKKRAQRGLRKIREKLRKAPTSLRKSVPLRPDGTYCR